MLLIYVMKPDDTYSVMQSDRNSFCGDVVSDSFNKTSWDKNSSLDQIYTKQICSEFYYDVF